MCAEELRILFGREVQVEYLSRTNLKSRLFFFPDFKRGGALRAVQPLPSGTVAPDGALLFAFVLYMWVLIAGCFLVSSNSNDPVPFARLSWVDCNAEYHAACGGYTRLSWRLYRHGCSRHWL